MMRIMKKLREKKGFTLAELLIVVAIIAVLVAIALPVFFKQLEKSREATDEANLRSIYAQLMADVMTEETTTEEKKDYNGAASYEVKKGADGIVTGTAKYTMRQQKSGLANGNDIEIGGKKIAAADFKTGTCTITVTSDGTAPTFTWATSGSGS